MRLRSPSSRGSFRARLSIFDLLWAMVSPLVALYLTDAQVLYHDDLGSAALYCSAALLFSLLTFVGFKLRDGLIQYFSVNDALDVMKAVIVAELLTGATLFTLTRLEGVPRSAPVVHALVLAAGLILYRLIMRMTHVENRPTRAGGDAVAEHILMIGATRLSAQYIQLIEAVSSHRRQVVALLDERPERIGRSLFRVRVVALTQDIEATIDEYIVHGIQIDRVIVGGDADSLSGDSLREVRRVCANRRIALDFVPDLIGLRSLQVPEPAAAEDSEEPAQSEPMPLSGYFRVKRIIDVIVAAALVVLLFPIILVVCALSLFDVGSPIFFWQQRIGRGGRTFLLYKVRTLRTPFDWRGLPVPEGKRLSWIGRMLRSTRLDEFPQLLNVLIGDMSLIGPRPLLPVDQPLNPAARLLVRPGITGWAQLNGGVNLTPEEKSVLDEWYIRNASIWLDLRIVYMTIRFVFTSEWDSSKALALARADQAARAGSAARAGDASPSLALQAERLHQEPKLSPGARGTETATGRYSATTGRARTGVP